MIFLRIPVNTGYEIHFFSDSDRFRRCGRVVCLFCASGRLDSWHGQPGRRRSKGVGGIVYGYLKAPIVNGSYEIAGLKPGTYKVIIEAKPPYRNAAKDGVMVSDGQSSDAGEIRLEK